ncbi:MAG: hypothetical protein F6K21_05595 [Symploca sp. SIO2D2]|nr:hypothetical protein [Symploca sp. SIO2D2]
MNTEEYNPCDEESINNACLAFFLAMYYMGVDEERKTSFCKNVVKMLHELTARVGALLGKACGTLVAWAYNKRQRGR